MGYGHEWGEDGVEVEDVSLVRERRISAVLERPVDVCTHSGCPLYISR